MSTPWRYHSIFITSTFRDFQSERDHLRNVVFPALEERMHARRSHLELIDLRWGVETTTETEAYAKEMLILKVCLAEVDRSRPFLIGLVGDRYGGILPRDRMSAAAREAGFTGDLVTDRSLTELEIEFGVLSRLEQRQRCFFYFRDALPYERMPAEEAAMYSELHGPGAQEGWARVEALKARIIRAVPDRVRRYAAHWDARTKTVAGLEEWGRQVLEDLWNELDHETAQYAASTPSWQEQERFLLEQYVENCTRDFVGREALVSDLVRFASADGPQGEWGVCVSASSGAGKSALFARLRRELENTSALVLAHAAGISPLAGGVEGMLLRWIEELARELNVPNPLAKEQAGTLDRMEQRSDDANQDDALEPSFQRGIALRKEGRLAESRELLQIVLEQRQIMHGPEHHLVQVTLSQLGRTLRADGQLEAARVAHEQTLAIRRQVLGDHHERTRNSALILADTLSMLGELQQARELRAAVEALPDSPAALVHLDSPVLADDKVTSEVIEQTFSWLLKQVSAKKRVVLLVDGLDQFRPSPWALHLTWLTRPQLENARFIVTSAPGRQIVALAARPGVKIIPIHPLSRKEATAIVATICSRYGRSLSREVVTVLVEKRTADDQCPADNPLWLTLAVQELNLLDADDFSRAEREYDGTAEQKLHQLLVNTVEQLPPTIPELYGRLIARAQRFSGRAWARNVVELIAISRFGWRELDFERVLPTLANEPWDHLRFATLRRTFRGQIVERGGQGQWDFAHKQLRMAILTQLLPSEADRRLQHARLAEHLLTLPEEDPVHRSETMIHLMGAGLWDRAAAYYGAARTAAEANGATNALAAWVSEGGDDAWNRLTSLLRLPVDDGIIANLCERFSFALADALENEAPCGRRIVVSKATLEAAQQLAERNPTDSRRRRAVKVAFDNLGALWLRQGSLDEAAAAYEGAMANLVADTEGMYARDSLVTTEGVGAMHEARGNLTEGLRAFANMLKEARGLSSAHPANLEFVDDVIHAYLHISTVQVRLGNLEDALGAATAAMKMCEQQCALRHVTPERNRDRLLAYMQVGVVQQARGDVDTSLKAFRSGLKISERLVEQDPSNGQWRQLVATLHMYVGSTLQMRGDLERALASYRAGLDVSERLVEQDPSNGQWRQLVASLHTYVGSALQARGELERALASYRAGLDVSERLVQQDPSNGPWRQIVATLHMYVGSTLQTRGDLERALASYRAGLDVSERLVQQDPSNGQWRQLVATLHMYVGSTLQTRGDLERALASYQAGLDVSERLVQQDPSNGQWRQLVATLHMYVGSALQTRGDLERALASYRAGLNVSERLVEQDPSNGQWRQLVASLHTHIGSALETRGELERALASYRAGLDVSERLVEQDPSNGQWRQIVASLHTYVGSALQTRGDLERALASYQAGLDVSERLVEQDPSNGQWRQIVASLHMHVGSTLQTRGDLERALASYRAGLDVSERLVEQDPSNGQWRQLVANLHMYVGSTLQTRGDLERALASYRAGLDVSERLVEQDPSNGQWRQLVASLHTYVGSALQTRGDLERALASYQAGLDVSERLVEQDPSNGQWRQMVAKLYMHLGSAFQTRGELSSALDAILKGLENSQLLAGQRVGDSAWQRDVWVACFHAAVVLERMGQAEARTYWKRGADTLSALKAAGQHLSDSDGRFLETMRQKADAR